MNTDETQIWKIFSSFFYKCAFGVKSNSQPGPLSKNFHRLSKRSAIVITETIAVIL
jgi:hypothetical protein